MRAQPTCPAASRFADDEIPPKHAPILGVSVVIGNGLDLFGQAELTDPPQQPRPGDS
jgi:hypothetical protein